MRLILLHVLVAAILTSGCSTFGSLDPPDPGADSGAPDSNDSDGGVVDDSLTAILSYREDRLSSDGEFFPEIGFVFSHSLAGHQATLVWAPPATGDVSHMPTAHDVRFEVVGNELSASFIEEQWTLGDEIDSLAALQLSGLAAGPRRDGNGPIVLAAGTRCGEQSTEIAWMRDLGVPTGQTPWLAIDNADEAAERCPAVTQIWAPSFLGGNSISSENTAPIMMYMREAPSSAGSRVLAAGIYPWDTADANRSFSATLPGPGAGWTEGNRGYLGIGLNPSGQLVAWDPLNEKEPKAVAPGVVLERGQASLAYIGDNQHVLAYVGAVEDGSTGVVLRRFQFNRTAGLVPDEPQFVDEWYSTGSAAHVDTAPYPDGVAVVFTRKLPDGTWELSFGRNEGDELRSVALEGDDTVLDAVTQVHDLEFDVSCKDDRLILAAALLVNEGPQLEAIRLVARAYAHDCN